MDRQPPRTLLEQLIRRSRRTIEESCAAFEKTARENHEKATLSPRQLSRWLSGNVGAARPVAQRVAALHWSHDFERLVGPPLNEAEVTTSGSARIKEPSDESLPTPDAVLRHVEHLRRGLHDAVSTESVSGASLDEWELTVLAHGEATRFRPAGQMLVELAADFTELQRLFDRRHSASALSRLTRATAQMAGLMFLTLVKLGEPLAARSWARTARIAADEAGDNDTRSWVRAQEAYVHYYASNLSEAITVARQAQALAGRSNCVGVPLAAALEARALGAQGDQTGAVAALERAETALSALNVDALQPSAFGYNEAQLRFHEGNAHTHLRDTSAARAAQERALRLVPNQDFLDRTLIHLDAAACLAHDREVDEAMQVAISALLDLKPNQRQGLALLRGAEVLQSLPQNQRVLPAVRDFHDLLVSSKGAH